MRARIGKQLGALIAALGVTAPAAALAQSGRFNLRFEAGPNWTPDQPMSEEPIDNPGFHGGVSLDAPLFRWMNVVAATDIDTYTSSTNQRDEPMIFPRGGLKLNPVNFDRGMGWLEGTAGVAFMEDDERLGYSLGAGYQAYFGRLGIGPYGRYTQIIIPSDQLDGTDIKMATFGLTGAITVVPPRRPTVPPPPLPPPVPVVEKDVDSDGVPDDRDNCLGTRAGRAVDPQGCEIVAAPVDSDSDGVPDTDDRCANTSAGARVDTSGCPEAPPPPPAPVDADSDGVAGDTDRCPDTPTGIPVDSAGCTSLPSGWFQIASIRFKANSTALEDGSEDAIREIARVMNDNPSMKLKVVGHAAESDQKKKRAKYYKNLGHQRAHAVEQIMMEEGVSGKRVVAIGDKIPSDDTVSFKVTRR